MEGRTNQQLTSFIVQWHWHWFTILRCWIRQIVSRGPHLTYNMRRVVDRPDSVQQDTLLASPTTAVTSCRRIRHSRLRTILREVTWPPNTEHQPLTTDHLAFDDKARTTVGPDIRNSMTLTSDHAKQYMLSMASYRFSHRTLVLSVVFYRIWLFHIISVHANYRSTVGLMRTMN